MAERISKAHIHFLVDVGSQEKLNNLDQAIENQIVRPGIAAFDTLGASIEQAFAKISKAPADLKLGMAALGQKTAKQLKDQIKAVAEAYKEVRDSGTASFNGAGEWNPGGTKTQWQTISRASSFNEAGVRDPGGTPLPVRFHPARNSFNGAGE